LGHFWAGIPMGYFLGYLLEISSADPDRGSCIPP
jgi:hypothetical protein